MADLTCTWAGVDAEGRYPCRTHKGGFLEVGGNYCSVAPGFWAHLERTNRRLAMEAVQQTRKELEALGWTFTGFTGSRFERWTARWRDDTVTADTAPELVRKVRQAVGLEPKATQGVLL